MEGMAVAAVQITTPAEAPHGAADAPADDRRINAEAPHGAADAPVDGRSAKAEAPQGATEAEPLLGRPGSSDDHARSHPAAPQGAAAETPSVSAIPATSGAPQGAASEMQQSTPMEVEHELGRDEMVNFLHHSVPSEKVPEATALYELFLVRGAPAGLPQR